MPITMTRSQRILANIVDKIENPPHRHYAGLDDTLGNTHIHFYLDDVGRCHQPFLRCLSVLSGTLDYFAVVHFNDEDEEWVEVWLKREDYLDILEQDKFTVQRH